MTYDPPGWGDERTRRMPAERGKPRGTPTVNAARLWAAGAATAVVAALIALVGLLIVRALLQLPYLAPLRSGALGEGGSTALLCVVAALAALAATGLVHLLLLSTPRPLAYFGWIGGLVTAIAVVLPLLSTDPWPVRLASGVIHLVIGIAIISLVTGAAAASTRAA